MIGNMKFPGPSKTWEALLSDIPIPTLTKFLFSREQVHQAPTGREERDFLSDKAKISKPSLLTTTHNRGLSNLFPNRKDKDQFTKLTKNQNVGNAELRLPTWTGQSSPSFYKSISLGSFRGLCAANPSQISSFKLRNLIVSCLLLSINNSNKSWFFCT